MASLPPHASREPSSSRPKDTLSIPANLFYRLGLPLTTSAIYFYSPATALFTPLVAGPTAILLYQRAKQPPEKRPADRETLVWTFLGAATVAPVLSMAVQGLLSYATASLVFGTRTGDYITEFTRSTDEVRSLPLDAVQKRKTMAHSWPYIAYLTFFSFGLAGLPEELCKYAILKVIERQQSRPKQQNDKDKTTIQAKLSAGDYIIYARAIGLGFSFCENLAFIYAAATTDTRNMLLVTAAERILYGTAAHVLTAVLTGARMARSGAGASGRGKKLGWFRAILPSMLYHGAGDAFLLGACAWDGHPGWVHPDTVGQFAKYLVAPVTLLVGLGLQVKGEMDTLRVTWAGTAV